MATYRVRHDGWTPQRRRAFLRALGETGCVRDACARARISNTSAYRMRRRCPVFAKAWDRALAKVAPTIEQAAFERAVNGWEEPVWHGGKLVGYRRRFSDGLLRLLLTRGAQRGTTPEEEADRFPRSKGWDRATQAETDALLMAKLKAFRRRLEAEKAQKALPAPALAATTPPTEQGEGDAGDADRGAAGAVRDGDGPRIWTLPG